ncbi:MAG: 5-formyltetrahydrofolate cyclo-ligase [Verrucomicrobia bacterium]|nr:MAG: 5-formyltetrahydrofolate cyclo-ligase [Verrucomicrobiota bacterium]
MSLTHIFHSNCDKEPANANEKRRAMKSDDIGVSPYRQKKTSSSTQYPSGFPTSSGDRHEIGGLTISKQKQLLRSEMRLLLKKNQKKKSASKSSKPLFEKKFLTLPQWEEASSILLYAPLPEEPDLLSCLKIFSEKRFFFPRIEKNKLSLYEWSSQRYWVFGSYGLQEPDPNTWTVGSIEEIDLAVIPGLAFDDRGGRLGRGGGFYDRLLSDPRWRGWKVGAAWPWHVVRNVPREPHDVMMDALLVF